VDKELFNDSVQIERKYLSFSLRENARGRFIRITEDVGGRRDAVVIPASGLESVRDILNQAIDADKSAGPFSENS
jgi:hypothetical protein